MRAASPPRKAYGVLVTAWCLAIAYSYPGYLNWDSGEQLFGLRHGALDDWHPPLMATYWKWIEHLVRGPLGMLVLQTSLVLGGLYGVLRRRCPPMTAALLAAGVFLFPPVLCPMAVVWKDAQMAGFLLAGLALALQLRWGMRVAALVMFVFACGVRDNGAAALPPLCLLVLGSWQLTTRRLVVIAASLALFAGLGVVAVKLNDRLTDHRSYPWLRSVAIHDIAGAICRENPMTDAQVRDLLAGIELHETSDLQARICKAYDPRVWFSLTYEGPGRGIFVALPGKAERLARRHAWWRIVREHTGAYLAHRWGVTRRLLGLSSDPVAEPVNQTTANSAHLEQMGIGVKPFAFQTKLARFFAETLATTLLFRPWAYLVIGLVMFGYALRKRDGWLCAVLGSGLLYEASYFIGAAAPDYRYSHWMITCVTVATITIFIERLRRGRSLKELDLADAQGKTAGDAAEARGAEADARRGLPAAPVEP